MANADAGWKDREIGSQDQTLDWRRAHDELLRIAEECAGLDLDEGRWLLAALRLGTHVRLGYGQFSEYAERLFGYGPRLTQEKLRVAEALEELPEMAEALRAGQTCWSAVRELTRVATPATERKWLDVARGRTVREIERLVSGRRPGDRPSDPGDPRLKRHVLRLEVSGETLACFREAMAKIRRDAGEPLDDDAAVLLLARHVLGGPVDERRASYQIALTVCEQCGSGRQHGSGELVEVAPEVVETAECDAQRIGNVHVGRKDAAAVRATQDVPPAVRRAVLHREGGRCVFPGCRSARFLDVHHIDARAEGGRHELDNLITTCGAHHRAIHRGDVVVERSGSAGLRFRHADGTAYGGAVSPAAADVRAKAFRALTGMGFREGEVRRVLEQVAPHVGVNASLEALIRHGLLALTGGIELSAS